MTGNQNLKLYIRSAMYMDGFVNALRLLPSRRSFRYCPAALKVSTKTSSTVAPVLVNPPGNPLVVSQHYSGGAGQADTGDIEGSATQMCFIP